VSAFANCGRASHTSRGSYVPETCAENCVIFRTANPVELLARNALCEIPAFRTGVYVTGLMTQHDPILLEKGSQDVGSDTLEPAAAEGSADE
jgi:hypothetical protein